MQAAAVKARSAFGLGTGVSAADRVGRGLGQAEVAHLASLHELGDGASDVLDRDVGVDAMLVEQIDHLDPQPAQRCIGDLRDLLGAAVEPDRPAVLDAPPELRGDHDLVAQRREGLTDEFFVDVGAVDLGGIEERDVALDRATQHADHGVAVAGVGAVALGALLHQPGRWSCRLG
jgi:hypothetical protein